MSIVYWCLHIWGDSIQAACSGNGQANFDKEFETMIDNGRETLQVVLQKREEVYRKAREHNSQRWSGKTRSWEKIAGVRLNWLKDDESSAKQINIR